MFADGGRLSPWQRATRIGATHCKRCLSGMPVNSKRYAKTHENDGSSGFLSWTSEGFVSGGHAVRGTQNCRASWGPCVVWGSLTLEGLGPRIAWCSSLTCQPLQGEVGGRQWLSGVRHGVSRKARAHLTTRILWLHLHQAAPLPATCSKLVPRNLCHCTPANDVVCNYQLL